MPVSLTRSLGFRATHRYFKPAWSEDTNRSRFGWTAEEPGHAHDYHCSVTVTGPLDADTDMILDLPALDRILAEEVTARLDGRDRKSTRLNSSHSQSSYAVFCLKKKTR